MRNPSRQIVVTGVGVCCHMGDELDRIQSDLREGHSTPFQRWEPAVQHRARCQIIGVYPHELSPRAMGLSKQQSRFMGRASLMALHAAQIALEQSGLDPKESAVVVGSGTGDVAAHVEVHTALAETKNARKVSPTLIPRLMASTVSANLATVFGTTGPSFTASAACAGGAYNTLLAAEFIDQGRVESAVVGGVEVADIHFFAGFDSMRAYNSQDNDHPERASRPYAADRAGFVFSEGAGILVLESRDAASRRGAKVLGTLKGYGMSSDGDGEMVAPSTHGAVLAMERALEHAGVEPDEVDYVNTHATSTPLGDVSEVRAMRQVFRDRHLPYSSTKGYTGHPVSAAGAIEAVFTMAMLRGGWIAPSVNAHPLEPELTDYPPILGPTRRAIRIAVSNSFGFGGTNAVLVFEAP